MAGYIALVHKDKGTSYGVSFPDVPGCISAGDTFEEAVANAAEALAGHFATMRADGEAVPSPRSFEQLKRDPEFIEDSAGAIVTMVNPRGAMAAAESGTACSPHERERNAGRAAPDCASLTGATIRYRPSKEWYNETVDKNTSAQNVGMNNFKSLQSSRR